MQDREATQDRRVFRVFRASAVTLVRKEIRAVKDRKEIWVPKVRQALREMWGRQGRREISVPRGRQALLALWVPRDFPGLWAPREYQAPWARGWTR